MSDYSNLVVADGAQFYFRMGEASGALVEVIGAHNTTVQTNLTYAQAGAIVGDPDTAISFGVTSTTTAPSNAAFDFGNGPMSIEIWWKQSAIGVIRGMIVRGTTGGNAYEVFIATDNTLRFSNSSGTTFVSSSGAVTDTTLWHHSVFQKNGASRFVYLDGKDVTSLGTDLTLANSTSVLTIGASSWQGLLDEIAGYPSILSPAQVLNHWVVGQQKFGHIQTEEPSDLIAAA